MFKIAMMHLYASYFFLFFGLVIIFIACNSIFFSYETLNDKK